MNYEPKEHANAFNEFVPLNGNTEPVMAPSRTFQFFTADSNGDSKLDSKEVQVAWDVSRVVANSMIMEADVDGDSTINFAEFLKIMQVHSPDDSSSTTLTSTSTSTAGSSR